MNLKSTILAGAVLVSLAAPAAALAQPWWGGHDRDDWRRAEWRAHERWAYPRYYYGGPVVYAPRCVIEDRGFYNPWGRYEHPPVRVCY